MAQAKILVNGIAGSNDDLPINTLVQLNNQNIGGETTYIWAILDQPVGPPDSLSSLVVQNPTLTPKKEGTYLIQLTVNLGLPTEVTDSVICAVRQLKTRQRIPAAGETTQDNVAEGWALSANAYLKAMDTQLSDPGISVGVDTAGGLVAGDIVNPSSSPTIKTGLPGQETVPGFTIASASSAATFNGFVAIVVSGVDGDAGPYAVDELIRVRFIGRVPSANLSGATLGQIVYLSNAGTLSLTQGTNRRQVGTVMAVVSGTQADVWFDGVGGFELTPVNAPYLINGPDAVLTGATDVTNLTATLHFAQKTGSGAVDVLHLDLLSGATGDSLVITKNGTDVFEVDANGNVVFGSGPFASIAITGVTFSPTSGNVQLSPAAGILEFVGTGVRFDSTGDIDVFNAGNVVVSPTGNVSLDPTGDVLMDPQGNLVDIFTGTGSGASAGLNLRVGFHAASGGGGTNGKMTLGNPSGRAYDLEVTGPVTLDGNLKIGAAGGSVTELNEVVPYSGQTVPVTLPTTTALGVPLMAAVTTSELALPSGSNTTLVQATAAATIGGSSSIGSLYVIMVWARTTTTLGSGGSTVAVIVTYEADSVSSTQNFTLTPAAGLPASCVCFVRCDPGQALTATLNASDANCHAHGAIFQVG